MKKSLEIPDDSAIDGGANYDLEDPLRIENPDPDMHYYFAANDDDKIRPDGITRCQTRGYKVSEKKHSSPDCTLMEIPRDIWERWQLGKKIRRRQQQRDIIKPPPGLEVIPGRRHEIQRKD